VLERGIRKCFNCGAVYSTQGAVAQGSVVQSSSGGSVKHGGAVGMVVAAFDGEVVDGTAFDDLPGGEYEF
jgi:hypothetical protein